MSYSYATQRAELFTESGLTMFTEFRDKAIALIEKAGAFMNGRVSCSGDSWTLLACADLMIERGELIEVTINVWGQHRVFIAGPNFHGRGRQ